MSSPATEWQVALPAKKDIKDGRDERRPVEILAQGFAEEGAWHDHVGPSWTMRDSFKAPHGAGPPDPTDSSNPSDIPGHFMGQRAANVFLP